MFLLTEAHAFGVLLDEHGADALGTRVVAHAAVNEIAVGVAAARAPALHAVDAHTVAADFGACGQVRECTARVGFAHGDGHDHLARTHGRHDALLQGVGAEVLDGFDGARAAFENGEGDGR